MWVNIKTYTNVTTKNISDNALQNYQLYDKGVNSQSFERSHKDSINYCYFLTEHDLACVQKMYLDFSNNITCLIKLCWLFIATDLSQASC